jgi:tetratricopeptide (TPR) repeat protein
MLEANCLIPRGVQRLLLTLITFVGSLLFFAWLWPFAGQAFAGVDHPRSIPVGGDQERKLPPLSIDYPENGSIFPPGITPPTFLWRDAVATSWQIEISFADKSQPVHASSSGERMHIGPIDPQCVSSSNQPPSLTPQQAASWTWLPDAATWSAVQLHSAGRPATVTITGYRGKVAASRSRITISTSRDPVGAPIFYRDVPLMPTAGADGIVQPLAPSAIPLIHWRLRDIRKPESHTVLQNMPTCANCHSFSGDGKTMGIDVDGPANDKGLYAIVPVERHMAIQSKDVVQWNTDGDVGQTRVGFMSQVSPDGQYIVSTFAGRNLNVPQSYFVTNFKDYRFLQVFYPTRGILEYYSRTAAKRYPLPGADDPHFVQTDGVWSPDGKYVVFARAVARDPHVAGQKPAMYANDPNETKIQYDLYRVPFNDGKGGTPERIVGASQNGMSNNFPKVSPDGKWIVFVQCRNGQLMRPDSQLYIVPFGGGVARRMRANTPTMNSWHSFSPNGRWLVFSSKARSPYTQMYLTHIDANGDDSPAILIDNATAANRAVNLPEFVNIGADEIEDIQTPAVDLYRLLDQAEKLQVGRQNDQALETWRKALSLDPDNASIHNNLAVSLYLHGNTTEAFDQVREALRINPSLTGGHYNLGRFLSMQGQPDKALTELERTVALNPRYPSAEEALATVYDALGKDSESLAHWRKALVLEPKSVWALLGAARILATAPDPALRNGTEAVTLATQANQITSGADPGVLDTLSEAYAEAGQFAQALTYANRALSLSVARGDSSTAAEIRNRIKLYTANTPYHYQRPQTTASR